MKRPPLIIGNWKMQHTRLGDEVAAHKNLTAALRKERLIKRVEMVVCPSFLGLGGMAKNIKASSGLALGAQDCAANIKGAFTGEVSPAMLEGMGVRYVLIGHSERRQYCGEDAVMIRAKLQNVLANTKSVTPVLCVGENTAERERGETAAVLGKQLAVCTELSLSPRRELIIAYEPVWAIGTSSAATPAQCAEAAGYITTILGFYFTPAKIAKQIRIIYGGSVSKQSTAGFMVDGGVQGLLVGGASLKVRDFCGILHAAADNS